LGDKILAALNQAYDLAGQNYHCSASMGVAMWVGRLHSVDELMKYADLAMYEAKRAGRRTLRFFDPAMQAAIHARAALEHDLREGVSGQQFLLYYQPQVDAHGHITGAEALLRWQHPRRGLALPSTFIPLVEETGLILTIGPWVLEAACQQLAAWAHTPHLADLCMAVNVSAAQLKQADFAPQVLATLARCGANPKRLKLELTESLLLTDVEETKTKMEALQAHGISFSLDDFGTGYSSLSYLKRLPFDLLKIDQSFVRDLLTDPNDEVIARTIVLLAHSLGLSVMAEGVETLEQRDCLIAQGCGAFQGYWFSAPLPIAEFERLNFTQNGK
jgi:EAL domain-containing protein (putative c-di-GMP-specific phosphodiesterase class I)